MSELHSSSPSFLSQTAGKLVFPPSRSAPSCRHCKLSSRDCASSRIATWKLICGGLAAATIISIGVRLSPSVETRQLVTICGPAILSLRFSELMPAVMVSFLAIAPTLASVHNVFTSTNGCDLSIPLGNDPSSCATIINSNILAGCGGTNETGYLVSHRALANVPSTDLGRGAMEAPSRSGIQSYMRNHHADSTWSFVSMSSWDTMATGEWWAFNIWFMLGILIGVLLLIGLIGVVLPLLWCGYCRRHFCIDYWKRPRSDPKFLMKLCYVVAMFAVFAAAVSILYAVWLKEDTEGARCSPHVAMQRLVYLGTEWNSASEHRYGGIQSWLDFAQQIRTDRNVSWTQFDGNTFTNDRVGTKPLASLEATQSWLMTQKVLRPLRKTSNITEAYVPVFQTIQGYASQEREWVLSDVDFTGGIASQHAARLADATLVAQEIVDAVSDNMTKAIEVAMDSLYPKINEDFVGPIQSSVGDKTTYTWYGLLAFLALPAIGWLATIIYVVRYFKTREFMALRETGASRRIAGFFVFGFCLWAAVLWIVSCCALSWLYYPSEVCRWFERDLLEEHRFEFYNFVDTGGMSSWAIDACLKDPAPSFSTFESYNGDREGIMRTDIFDSHVDQTYLDKLGTFVPNLNVTGAIQGLFSEPEAELLHASVVVAGVEDPWAEVRSAWQNPLRQFDCDPSEYVCLEGIGGSPDGTCTITIRMDWVAGIATTYNGTMDVINITSVVDWIPRDAPAMDGAYDNFTEWLASCNPTNDPAKDKRLAQLIYAGTLKSALAAPVSTQNVGADRVACSNCSLFSVVSLDGDTKGTPVDAGDYEAWVRKVPENINTVTKSPDVYEDLVNSYIINAGGSPLRYIRSIVQGIDTNYDCREAAGTVRKIADRLCSGVVGGMAVIAYCCLALALFHTVAFFAFLRYWKARKTYDDYLQWLRYRPPPITKDAFLVASQEGKLDKTKVGADWYKPDEVRDVLYSNTPLHLASFYGHEACVDYLLKKGYDPNQRNDHFQTPFTGTCMNAELAWLTKKQVLQKLYDSGADLELYDYQGDTPLLVATRLGDQQLVEYLLTLGSNPFVPDTIDGIDSARTAEVKGFPGIQSLIAEASPRHRPAMGLFETAFSSNATMESSQSPRSPQTGSRRNRISPTKLSPSLDKADESSELKATSEFARSAVSSRNHLA